MGRNKSKRKEVTEFQRHESRMDKLAYRLKKEEEERMRRRREKE